MYLFEGLKAQISEYLPSDQVDRVAEAFVVANDAHSTQKRSSGEPLHYPSGGSSQLTGRYAG